MLRLLTDRFQVDHTRLSVAGHADTIPVASNETEEGRARNRRVDIVLQSAISLRPEAAENAGEPAAPAH
jgi:chemotaxis protein MotB